MEIVEPKIEFNMSDEMAIRDTMAILDRISKLSDNLLREIYEEEWVAGVCLEDNFEITSETLKMILEHAEKLQ